MLNGILGGMLGGGLGGIFGSGIGGATKGLFGSGSPSLSQIAGGVMKGWQGVAAQAFATAQGIAQNQAAAEIQQDAMQKQAIIKLVTDMIEGTCKMIKACGEAVKGLCG
jgi:hypothetical protein